MHPETLNYLSVSGFLIFVLSAATCSFVLFHNPRKAANITWSLFSFCLALWSLGLFMGWTTRDYNTALFWSRWLNLSAVFIPVFFVHFVLSFLEKTQKEKKFLLTGYLITVSYFLTALMSPDEFVKSVSAKGGFLYYPDAGSVYYFFPVLFTALVFWGVFELYQAKKILRGQKQKQAQYLFTALLIGFAGGSTTFPLVFGINFYPFGTIGVVILNIIFPYTIVRHELLDIKIFISRGVARLATYIFLITIYLSLYAIFYRVIEPYHILFTALITPLFFIIALESYPFIRNRIQTIPDAILVKSRYDLDKVKERFLRDMERVVSLEEFFAVMDSFFRGIDLYPVSFYLPDNFEEMPENPRCYLKWDLKMKKPDNGQKIDREMHIIRQAVNTPAAVFYDRADKNLQEELDRLGADCVIPIVFKSELLCLIVISADRIKPVRYTSIDEALFLLISGQIVMVLNRLRPYEKLQSDYEKSRKLAEEALIHKQYTQVARQIAHDIRNPAGAMMLLTQQAQKIVGASDFKGRENVLEYLEDIIYDAGRITKTADTCLKYAFADPGDKTVIEKQSLNVNELLKKTINLFKGKGLVQQINIVSRLHESLP
ncbi:MAG: hypothetical protein GXP46_04625, partial [Deferribacteres bacterium]|nr:hypothetical protein [Deferribacteres bacterium]